MMPMSQADRALIAEYLEFAAIQLRQLADDPLEVHTSRAMADRLRQYADDADVLREKLEGRAVAA